MELKTIDPTFDDQIVMLIYGPSGSGKTRLVGSFQQFVNVLILACDPGKYGGARSAAEFHPFVHVVKDFSTIYTDILETRKYVDENKIDLVAADSISYLQRIVMRQILGTIGREIPRFEEWNLNAERMRKIINLIAEIPAKFVIFTAIDEISKDEVTGKMIGGPALPGKLSKELPQACDIVIRLYTTTSIDAAGKIKVNYRMRTVPDDIYFAKDRTNLLPADAPTSIETFKPLFVEEVKANGNLT